MNQWWYIDDDASQIRGPCDRIQIVKWSEDGWLRPETLVARTPTSQTAKPAVSLFRPLGHEFLIPAVAENPIRLIGRFTHSTTSTADKGYGFITPSTGGKNIFCHARNVGDGVLLQASEQVEFEVSPDGKGRAQAINVTAVHQQHAAQHFQLHPNHAGQEVHHEPVQKVYKKPCRRRRHAPNTATASEMPAVLGPLLKKQKFHSHREPNAKETPSSAAVCANCTRKEHQPVSLGTKRVGSLDISDRENLSDLMRSNIR